MINQNMINEYSTDEKIVGKWVNGKPIYRKVIRISSYPNTGQQFYHLIDPSELDEITKLYGIMREPSSSKNTFLIPNLATTGSQYYVDISYIAQENGSIRIRTSSDRSGYSGFVIAEYTKITD